MTLVNSNFLAKLDKIRAIPGKLGLHKFRVYAIDTVNSASSEQHFGYGTSVASETELTVDGYPPKVVLANHEKQQEEMIASGGQYQHLILRIGPLTPTVINPSDYDPALAKGRSRKFRITGPGLPDNSFFKLISQEQTSALHFYLIVDKI